MQRTPFIFAATALLALSSGCSRTHVDDQNSRIASLEEKVTALQRASDVELGRIEEQIRSIDQKLASVALAIDVLKSQAAGTDGGAQVEKAIQVLSKQIQEVEERRATTHKALLEWVETSSKFSQEDQKRLDAMARILKAHQEFLESFKK